MVHRTIGWLLASLLIRSPATGIDTTRQGAIAESAKRPRASLCGRVVTMSCTSARSGVSLTLHAPSSRQDWTLVIPPERRALFGERIEDRYDQRMVCVTAPAPLGKESVVVTKPEQVEVKDAESPYPLPADVARSCDPDVRMPRAVHTVAASYTHSAMMAKINGRVILRAVVERDGVVGDVRVVRALEPTQDEEASKALAQWRFEPATRGGQPVAMAVTVEMGFSRR